MVYIHTRSGSERKHPYPAGRPANPTATGVARLCYPYILLLGLSRDTHPCLLNTPAGALPCGPRSVLHPLLLQLLARHTPVPSLLPSLPPFLCPWPSPDNLTLDKERERCSSSQQLIRPGAQQARMEQYDGLFPSAYVDSSSALLVPNGAYSYILFLSSVGCS